MATKRESERDKRIAMEIIVDCYNEAEQALGWYYYLEERLQFPFKAQCSATRSTSPLRFNQEVEVVGMAREEECEHEIFVVIRWERRRLAVPLGQLKPTSTPEQTTEAVEDWLYWLKLG